MNQLVIFSKGKRTIVTIPDNIEIMVNGKVLKGKKAIDYSYLDPPPKKDRILTPLNQKIRTQIVSHTDVVAGAFAELEREITKLKESYGHYTFTALKRR